jgi:hypothetical protein
VYQPSQLIEAAQKQATGTGVEQRVAVIRFSATSAATRMTSREATKIVTSPASSRKSSRRARAPVRQPWDADRDAVAVMLGLDI